MTLTAPAPVAVKRKPWGRLAGIAVVAALLVVYPLVMKTSFLQTIGVLALTMAIAATGWNILGGYAGQISFGHAVFFGTGMYGTAMLTSDGWSPWLTMIPVAGLAAAIGVLIGLPTFRLRGHYFSIATLAIGMMVMSILPNVEWFGAADGDLRSVAGQRFLEHHVLPARQDRVLLHGTRAVRRGFGGHVLLPARQDRQLPGGHPGRRAGGRR